MHRADWTAIYEHVVAIGRVLKLLRREVQQNSRATGIRVINQKWRRTSIVCVLLNDGIVTHDKWTIVTTKSPHRLSLYLFCSLY